MDTETTIPKTPLWRRALVPALSALIAGVLAVGALLLVQGAQAPSPAPIPTPDATATTEVVFGDICNEGAVHGDSITVCEYAYTSESKVLAFTDADGVQSTSAVLGGFAYLAGALVEGGEAAIPNGDTLLVLTVIERSVRGDQPFTLVAVTERAEQPPVTPEPEPLASLFDQVRAQYPDAIFLNVTEQPTTDAASVDLIVVPHDPYVVRGDGISFEAPEGYFDFTAFISSPAEGTVFGRDI